MTKPTPTKPAPLPSPSLGANGPRPRCDWSVYLVAGLQTPSGGSILDAVDAAIRGGITAVQLRDKHASTRDLLALGRSLMQRTRAAGIPLIVNDRVDVALALGADGVHVGQDDMPASDARRLIGPHLILGVSTSTVAEARAARDADADYLGVGDLFGTPSKSDAGDPIGLGPVADIAGAVPLPIVGIGGITRANAADVIGAGAAGVAVISAILAAADPAQASTDLQRSVRGPRHSRQVYR